MNSFNSANMLWINNLQLALNAGLYLLTTCFLTQLDTQTWLLSSFVIIVLQGFLEALFEACYL